MSIIDESTYRRAKEILFSIVVRLFYEHLCFRVVNLSLHLLIVKLLNWISFYFYDGLADILAIRFSFVLF